MIRGKKGEQQGVEGATCNIDICSSQTTGLYLGISVHIYMRAVKVTLSRLPAEGGGVPPSETK